VEAKSLPARYAAQIQETLRGLAWETLVRQLLADVE
jgi:hypothetical protein